MTDYYRNNPKDIVYEQLADNKQYHELLQKKIASQDAVGNELEIFRLETMYLAGAADYEKLFK